MTTAGELVKNPLIPYPEDTKSRERIYVQVHHRNRLSQYLEDGLFNPEGYDPKDFIKLFKQELDDLLGRWGHLPRCKISLDIDDGDIYIMVKHMELESEHHYRKRMETLDVAEARKEKRRQRKAAKASKAQNEEQLLVDGIAELQERLNNLRNKPPNKP